MENRFIMCGYCPFFRCMNGDGVGVCRVLGRDSLYGNYCYVGKLDKITKAQAANILHYFQKWRRGGMGKQPSGYLLGLALDEAIRSLRDDNRAGIR